MDHHHFELLVAKNVENVRIRLSQYRWRHVSLYYTCVVSFKENKLKIALLNYLDKHYRDDTEKHLLVAYRFNMHREVAVSLQTSADAQVTTLVKRGLGKTTVAKDDG